MNQSLLNQKNSERILRSEFFGGGGWIRTIEARRNRFTVCPLWPLGNSSIFNFESPYSKHKKVELVDGFEPPTC